MKRLRAIVEGPIRDQVKADVRAVADKLATMRTFFSRRTTT